MGSPADFAQTTTLTQVTSVRTCGDHGYIATPGQLWAWFCTTNALARALGLMPFKDVFRADPDVAGDHGEPEALLSALSTGPVGLGDRVGRFDPALAMRTCRADGVLIKPHVPIAATSRSMLANAGFRDTLMVAECWSDHPAGRWTYVTTMRCSPGDAITSGTVSLSDLGDAAPTGDVVVWNWRTGATSRLPATGSWTATLAAEEWEHHVVAPVLAGGIAVIGDTSKFVTAGDARVAVSTTRDQATGDEVVRLVVLGANETVTITGWSERAPARDGARVDHDAVSGVWSIDVVVPARGWVSVEITPAT